MSKRSLHPIIVLLLLCVSCAGALHPAQNPRPMAAPAAGGGGGGPITFVASGSNAVASSAGGGLTIPITLPQMTDGYIVAHCAQWHGTAGTTVNTATFDGGAMTGISANIPHPTITTDGRLFGLAIGNKAAGTYNVVVNPSTTGCELAVVLTAWDNVHQGTSVGTAASATGTGTGPTVNVTSATGEVVVDVLSGNENDIIDGVRTPGAGQTERRWASSADGNQAVACSTEAGAATTTMSWTIDSSAGWIIVGIPLLPANP